MSSRKLHVYILKKVSVLARYTVNKNKRAAFQAPYLLSCQIWSIDLVKPKKPQIERKTNLQNSFDNVKENYLFMHHLSYTYDID
jgi:hypothetical protein